MEGSKITDVLSLRIPKDKLKCDKCRQEERPGYRFEISADSPHVQKVNVLEMHGEYDEKRSTYKVKAKMEWKCPSCEAILHDTSEILSVPLEILQSAWGICPSCGNNTRLTDYRINIRSEKKPSHVIDVNGMLVCDHCRKSEPLQKKFTLHLESIWKSLKKIKKIRIAKDGLEIEK